MVSTDFYVAELSSEINISHFLHIDYLFVFGLSIAVFMLSWKDKIPPNFHISLSLYLLKMSHFCFPRLQIRVLILNVQDYRLGRVQWNKQSNLGY